MTTPKANAATPPGRGNRRRAPAGVARAARGPHPSRVRGAHIAVHRNLLSAVLGDVARLDGGLEEREQILDAHASVAHGGGRGGGAACLLREKEG